MPTEPNELIETINQVEDLNELKEVYTATQNRLLELGARRRKVPQVNFIVRAYLLLSPYVFCAAFIVPIALWLYTEGGLRYILGRLFVQQLIAAGVYGAVILIFILFFGRLLRSLVKVREK